MYYACFHKDRNVLSYLVSVLVERERVHQGLVIEVTC